MIGCGCGLFFTIGVTPGSKRCGRCIPSATGAWPGWREFRVVRRAFEDTARSQCSFYLQPVDGAPLPANVPGAIARTSGDTLSPLMAGVLSAEIPVLVDGGTIYTAPRDLRPGEAVVRFAAKDRVRLSGYFWPEVPERIAGSPYLFTERVGQGRVIGFAGDPNFRDLWRGLLPLFANAVFFGGSY